MLAHNCHIHNIYTNVTVQRNLYILHHHNKENSFIDVSCALNDIVVVCQLGFWCNIPPLLRTIGQ